MIALVDCHPDMFQKKTMSANKDDDDDDENNEPATTPIDLSIKLIQALLQQTIEQTVIRKTGKRNGIGLLLYNTKSKRGDDGEKGARYPGGDNDDNTDANYDDDDDDDDDKMDDEDDDEMDDEMDDEDTDDDNEDLPTIQQQQVETTVHMLLDLKPPGVGHVQTLRKLVVDKRRQQQRAYRDLQADFCPSVDDPDPTIAPLQTALEESTRMFLNAKCVRDPTKNVKGKNEYDTKSIWIFTNQTNPYSDEKSQLIQNIANEAKEERISIIVWPLPVHSNGKKHSFQKDDNMFVSPFFEKIASEILFDQRPQSYIELQDELGEICRSMAKKRRTYYGPMHILRPGKNVGNTRSVKDPAIMIDWYSVVQLQRRPGKVQIDTATKT